MSKKKPKRSIFSNLARLRSSSRFCLVYISIALESLLAVVLASDESSSVLFRRLFRLGAALGGSFFLGCAFLPLRLLTLPSLDEGLLLAASLFRLLPGLFFGISSSSSSSLAEDRLLLRSLRLVETNPSASAVV